MHHGWQELSGNLTVFLLVAHMVSTIPVSSNKWVNWVVGGLQFAVGQRLRALNTMHGEMTLSQPAGPPPPPAPDDSKTDIH